MSESPLLQLSGITKTFGGVTALEGVDLTLERGQVHALVGENGAGKSTLIKVMTGAYRRDGGTMRLEGKPVDFRSPQQAQAQGVVAVYQEINLLSFRSVAENLFLGREPTRWGWIDWRRINADAAKLLAQLGLPIDPTAELGRLTIALRQMVAIARGVLHGARVLILDEPTSSLTEREVATLFDLIRRLKSAGTAIVYVSHRFEELYAVCDRVTVLRDGKLVATRPLAEVNRLTLVSLMLGKSGAELPEKQGAVPPGPTVPARPVLLQAENLKRAGKVRGVSVEVRRGEIVGLAGLLGSGRTETARLLFGLDAREAGEVRLEGRVLTLRSPREAIAAGMAFLPEDRKAEGIIPELSVRENLTLAALPGLTRLGIVSRARQGEIVERFMARLRIKAASPEQKIRELSGGNQQKVLLARWLCRNPRFLILDEPTRGIDVGARAEIQALVNEMAEGGLGILFISSDLEELLGASSRVVVLRDGQGVATLEGADRSEGEIMRLMAGGTPS